MKKKTSSKKLSTKKPRRRSFGSISSTVQNLKVLFGLVAASLVALYLTNPEQFTKYVKENIHSIKNSENFKFLEQGLKSKLPKPLGNLIFPKVDVPEDLQDQEIELIPSIN